MRWLEKLHLDSPIDTQPIRRVFPGAPDRGTPGCASKLDERKQRPLGMQISAQSTGGRRHTGQAIRQGGEAGYLALRGARQVGRQLQPFGLLVVADGIGSQINSQRASGIVIEMLFEGLVPTLLQEELSDDELPLLLQDAVQSANQRLYRQNQRDQNNLGCAITAALVTKKEVSLCNVGNSRGYVLSEDARIKQKTSDHSIGESLVAAGILTREDASARPACGRIYRSLGQDWWVQIDMLRQALVSGDYVLLCSPGLWRRLSNTEMPLMLRLHPHPAEASSRLLGLAQEHDGLDTGTALLLRLSEEASCHRQQGIEQIESNQPIPLRHGFIRTR